MILTRVNILARIHRVAFPPDRVFIYSTKLVIGALVNILLKVTNRRRIKLHVKLVTDDARKAVLTDAFEVELLGDDVDTDTHSAVITRLVGARRFSANLAVAAVESAVAFTRVSVDAVDARAVVGTVVHLAIVNVNVALLTGKAGVTIARAVLSTDTGVTVDPGADCKQVTVPSCKAFCAFACIRVKTRDAKGPIATRVIFCLAIVSQVATSVAFALHRVVGYVLEVHRRVRYVRPAGLLAKWNVCIVNEKIFHTPFEVLTIRIAS